MCQASILARKTSTGPSQLFFVNPDSKHSREFLSLRQSDDQGETWKIVDLIHRGYAAYADIIELPENQISCLYECGKTWPYEGIAFQSILIKKD